MTHRAPRWALFLGLTLLLLIAANGHATQIVPRTTAQLSDGAESVVRGKVVQERAFWNEAGTRILTEVEIEVDESYKGSSASRVRVVQMGGVVGTTRMTVAGALAWRTGEEVLLFLEPSLPGTHRVSGFSQGKFLVEREGETGELMVRRPSLLGVEFAASDKADVGASIRIPLRDLLSDAGLSTEEVK